jgi:hypothetical protein
MRVEQAVYTSLPRGERSGYHVVSRSPGVSDSDARALASWSPSHGALLLDDANRVSVNFHPVSGSRYALSRSCEGRPEYSGRGGVQTYTHALIFDKSELERSHCGPVAVYGEALALGYLHYRPDPEPSLEPVELGTCHRAADPERGAALLRSLGLGDLADARRRLIAGESVQICYAGDRLILTECLLDLLPGEIGLTLSFSTSLQPSSTRPYRLITLG